MMNTTQRVATCCETDGVHLVEACAGEIAKCRGKVGLRSWDSFGTSTCGIDSAGSEGDLSSTAVSHTLRGLVENNER